MADYLSRWTGQEIDDRLDRAVPNTRKVNNKALSADITLVASDVGALGFIRQITSTDDMNAVKTTGLYYVGLNNYPSNMPEQAMGFVSVEVFDGLGAASTARVVQRFYKANTAIEYMRTYYAGTWTAWHSEYNSGNKPTTEDIDAVPTSRTVNGKALSADVTLSAEDVKALGFIRQITSTDDMNAVKTTGLYYVGLNNYPSNMPEQAMGFVSVEVFDGYGAASTARVVQRFYKANTAIEYMRTYYAGTWTAWYSEYNSGNKPTVNDVAGAAQIQTGTYVGTGTYGSENPTSLTLNFKPAVIGVFGGGYSMWIRIGFATAVAVSSVDQASNNITWADATNTVSWYTTAGVSQQLNRNPQYYHWIALE